MTLITIELNKNGSIKAASKKANPKVDEDFIFYLKLVKTGRIISKALNTKKIIVDETKVIFPTEYRFYILTFIPLLRDIERQCRDKYKESIWTTNKNVNVTKN
jgi:hypothetical protein